jgi:transposase
VSLAIEADLTMIDAFNGLIKPLEDKIERIACQYDPNNLYLLKTIPGVGQILVLTILYEVHDIGRFKTVQRFCYYARGCNPPCRWQVALWLPGVPRV